MIIVPSNVSASPVGSVFFNGSSQYMTVSWASNFSFGTGDYTVEFWMKPLTNAGGIAPVTQTYGVNSWEFYYNWYSDRSMTWLFKDNGSTSAVGSVPLNTWTHVAGVRSGQYRSLYLNGTRAFLYDAGSVENFNSSGDMWLGYPNGLSGVYYNGYLSNVRIVKNAVYTSNFTVPTSPLTAISGTTFLACQGTLLDNGPDKLTINAYNGVTASTVSPF